jgi:hypothetical protein
VADAKLFMKINLIESDYPFTSDFSKLKSLTIQPFLWIINLKLLATHNRINPGTWQGI